MMRPVRRIATILLVAGCRRRRLRREPARPAQRLVHLHPGRHRATGTARTADNPTPGHFGGQTKSEPVVLADGRHPVYLKTVDLGRRTITFDLIQWYSGDDAAREAAKDHKESPPPNDYHIRNYTRPFWITVRYDQITKIAEQYIP